MVGRRRTAGLSEEEDMQGSSCQKMERGHRSLLANQNAVTTPTTID